MNTATVSSDYRVTIPKPVRDQLRLQPGQVLQVFAFGDRIEMLPLREAHELRGFLRGTDLAFEREEADRF